MTSYTPKMKQPAEAPGLPRDLAAALENARALLAETDRLHDVVSQTHTDIPALLARRADAQAALSALEIGRSGDPASIKAAREKLASIETERVRTVRQRQGALNFLLNQEPQLVAARAAVDTARAAFTTRLVAEFRSRYDATISALQNLWLEGAALQATLRAPVPMPDPLRLEGGRDLGCHPWPGEISPVKLVRVMCANTEPPEVDKQAAGIGAVLDRLDAAVLFCESIARQRRFEQQLGTRETTRAFDPQAIYLVVEGFMCHNDSLRFEQGALVDGSLIGPVSLQRLVAGKKLRLQEPAKAAAAAA
jgi:hypothetical protein